jgi:alkylation response protein AidB-like acyl-CoA dehydrogenase
MATSNPSMSITDAATRALVAIRESIPLLRENGWKADKDRWIPEENIRLLDEAGVTSMAVPREYGGPDLPLAIQNDILTEVSRGCGSTGWTAATWVSGAWMVKLFSHQAQKELYAGGPVRIAACFTPKATAEFTNGVYVLNGSWSFNSGCRAAQWDIVAATQTDSRGREELIYALVPMSDLTIADDWHVSAMSGTGSSTTTATGVRVPAHRVVTFREALVGTANRRAGRSPDGRDYSLVSFALAGSVPVYIGMAKAALELFLEHIPGRKVAWTRWTDQREHPLTHLRLASGANRIAAAEALAASHVSLMQRLADADLTPTVGQRAEIRGKCGMEVRLCREAVEDLHSVAGASALRTNSKFQRFHRDLVGLSLHGLFAPDSCLELHGRILAGLEPDVLYL